MKQKVETIFLGKSRVGNKLTAVMVLNAGLINFFSPASCSQRAIIKSWVMIQPFSDELLKVSELLGGVQ